MYDIIWEDLAAEGVDLFSFFLILFFLLLLIIDLIVSARESALNGL